MLPALLDALRTSDARRLEQLLAEEVTQLQGTQAAPRARGTLVERILRHARTAVIQPDAPIAELVDLESVEVERAARFYRSRAMPTGVRATDLVVRFRVLERGRGPLHAMFRWEHLGQMVVRPGRDPRIIAL